MPTVFKRIAIALLVSAAPSLASAEVFNPTTFELSNGMDVVLVENHSVPAAHVMVWYKVGAADEPAGKSGIAHFLEHLMFKGTDELAPGEFSRVVARNGGKDNAFTSHDYTAYHQTVAADRLDLALKLEADRMVDLQLTDEAVLPERDVVLEERRQRTENDPGARLREALNALLFVHHPYGTPVIGWRHEIAGLTREDALGFYRTWYNPANAVLVVSGDVTPERLKELAEAHFGALPAGEPQARVRTQEPDLGGERRVILRDEQVRQPALYRMWRAPSYAMAENGEAYALQVFAEIAGGGPTSRLYRSLVVDRKLAVSAGLYYSASALDQGTLGVYAIPAGDVDMATLEAALDAELKAILDEGVSEQEVSDAKTRLVSAAIYARDSLSGPANMIGRALTTGQTIDEIEAWPERIDAVTATGATEAARAALTGTGSATGLLLPAEDVEAPKAAAAAAPETAVAEPAAAPEEIAQ